MSRNPVVALVVGKAISGGFLVHMVCKPIVCWRWMLPESWSMRSLRNRPRTSRGARSGGDWPSNGTRR